MIFGEFQLSVMPSEIDNMKYGPHPVSMLIKRRFGIVHPVARLIKHRFDDYYNGPVTIYELDAIKEKLERTRKRLRDEKDEVCEERNGYINKIKEQQKMCGDECLKNLEEHLKICNGGYDKDDKNYGKPYYKCERKSVCYHCKSDYKNNGRCSHYYDIEYLEQQLENIEEFDDYLEDKIIDLQIDYERKLAIKEGKYEQYKEDLYYDY